MHNNRLYRYIIVFFVMLLLLLGAIVANVSIGSVNMSVTELLSALRGQGMDTNSTVLWQLRLPRLCMAMLLGGSLALSGFLLQTYFSNPVAGPFILGISSGAKLFVAIALLIVMKNSGVMSSAVLIIAAFIGAMLSTGFVLTLSKYLSGMGVLLVAGIMISYICSAITDFLITFADDADIVNLHSWSLGSFSGMNWSFVKTALIIVCISFIAVFLMAKPISAFMLGELYAKSMGVNVDLLRVVIIFFASLLAATVTAFAGPISFVGIAVPQLVRLCMKTSKPIVIIPASFLGGALVCLICDLIARCMLSPTELSISTVTAFFGAPVVLFMLLKRSRE